MAPLSAVKTQGQARYVEVIDMICPPAEEF